LRSNILPDTAKAFVKMINQRLEISATIWGEALSSRGHLLFLMGNLIKGIGTFI
jgi:hypothetical protein